jgi:hypothetical protein
VGGTTVGRSTQPVLMLRDSGLVVYWVSKGWWPTGGGGDYSEMPAGWSSNRRSWWRLLWRQQNACWVVIWAAQQW